MAKYQLGFIGCGNMGSALVRATASQIKPEEIIVADRMLTNLNRIQQSCGVCTAQDAAQVAAEAKYIFLGVKPQNMGELLADLSGELANRGERYVLISMAAGISLQSLEEMLVLSEVPIVRILPNTPAAVGQGMTLYCCNRYVSAEEEREIVHILKAAGKVDQLDENSIDAACAVSGCGPAFVYLFAEAMADGAVSTGLPRQKAMLYAAQTLLGAAEMILQSEKHPGELKDAVCSPGGSTIQGVRSLEQGAFRATVIDAVIAAYEKTRELGKNK